MLSAEILSEDHAEADKEQVIVCTFSSIFYSYQCALIISTAIDDAFYTCKPIQ